MTNTVNRLYVWDTLGAIEGIPKGADEPWGTNMKTTLNQMPGVGNESNVSTLTDIAVLCAALSTAYKRII